jgi:hypothetical protein
MGLWGPLGSVGHLVRDDDNKDYSLYFEEAENRLHVQKAVMALAMGDRVSRRRK